MCEEAWDIAITGGRQTLLGLYGVNQLILLGDHYIKRWEVLL